MGEAIREYFKDVADWFGRNALRTAITVVLAAVVIALTIIIAHFGSRGLKSFISRRGERFGKKQARFNTVSTLVGSLFKYIVWFFGILAVCLLLGLGSTVSTLLATAGIGGIAIGFGAQSLIKDFLSGIMLTSDNQYDVGDMITVGGITGVVEELKTRNTVLRAFSGEIHTIANGSISTVTNLSKGTSLAVSEVYVRTDEDFGRVKAILEECAARAAEGNENIIEPPNVLGITAFTDRGMMCIRTICRTKPLQHYELERAIRREQLQGLQDAGIATSPAEK